MGNDKLFRFFCETIYDCQGILEYAIEKYITLTLRYILTNIN